MRFRRIRFFSRVGSGNARFVVEILRIIETARIAILIIRARVLLYKIGKIRLFTLSDSVENLFVFGNAAAESGILKIDTRRNETASGNDNIAALRRRTAENVARRVGSIICRVAEYNALIDTITRRNGIPALPVRTAENTARIVGGIVCRVAE